MLPDYYWLLIITAMVAGWVIVSVTTAICDVTYKITETIANQKVDEIIAGQPKNVVREVTKSTVVDGTTIIDHTRYFEETESEE